MGGIFGKKKPKDHKELKITQTSTAPVQDRDYPAFKMLMIGDPGVGKSSLLLRYADNEFTQNFISTIGVDFKEKEININGSNITIQIWDTAGQERFRTITSSYYRGAHGMILTFDVTNPATFKSCSKWLQEVERYAEEEVVVFLAGNKCDLGERAVPTAEIEDFKAKYALDYIETSAKDGTGINELFEKLTRQVVERFNNDL
eukprot:TRINITY_DN3430_c0_g1_i6.p1 TRINITY_DN3430_c0_g1~~TRINITY_DN3430_c0_g1_i6.p1  ORF type:complete len:202 (-),score=30.86 TRINITY_DN3430_c0_g1_i6:110-715(-)